MSCLSLNYLVELKSIYHRLNLKRIHSIEPGIRPLGEGILREGAHWHQFQVFAKRAERIAELSPYLEWADNIWMGVSVEAEKYKYRIDHLRETDAKIKFLSLEPLIGPLGKLNLKKINWVIVGGKSGPGARLIMQEWVTDIRDQCLRVKVPFFFKQ